MRHFLRELEVEAMRSTAPICWLMLAVCIPLWRESRRKMIQWRQGVIVSTSATTSALVASERNVSTTRRERLSCYILLRKRRVTLVGSRLLSTNMGLVSHLHPRPSRDTRRRSASRGRGVNSVPLQTGRGAAGRQFLHAPTNEAHAPFLSPCSSSTSTGRHGCSKTTLASFGLYQ
ncbi:hypothetical protein BC629DRAFT_129239 [Irpex lacteus]|nr:hypothetical protein BC629DRAFT_129239 [Irpex lacteus]